MLVEEFRGVMEKEKPQRTLIDFERVEKIRQKSDELGFKKKVF